MGFKRQHDPEILRTDRIAILPSLTPHRSKKSWVALTAHAVHFHTPAREGVINLHDVIGCQHLQSNLDHDKDAHGYFTIYYYPLDRKTVRREKEALTVLFDKGDRAENLETGELWHRAVNLLLRGVTDLARDEVLSTPLPQRNVLVIVNPVSGRAKGLNIYREIASRMLVEASFKFKCIVTAGPGHASQVLMEEELEKWTSILMIGGDGIVYEVINALMARNDWKRAIKTPLGIVPAGSGNGLAASILYEVDELNADHCAMNCMFRYIKGSPKPMDITQVKVGHLTFYSFLSVSWGAIADIDINSERLRFIGPARYLIWSFGKIIQNKKYNGTIEYVEEKMKEAFAVIETEEGSAPIIREEVTETLTRNGQNSKNTMAVNKAEPVKSAEDQQVPERNETARSALMDHRRTHYSLSAAVVESLNRNAAREIDALMDEIPQEEWQEDHQNAYSFILASNISHIALDMNYAPGARIENGSMHLGFCRQPISRSALIKILTQIENGEHTSLEGMNFRQIKAFNITLPNIDDSTNIVIDGEKVPNATTIKCRVIPHLAVLIR